MDRLLYLQKPPDGGSFALTLYPLNCMIPQNNYLSITRKSRDLSRILG